MSVYKKLGKTIKKYRKDKGLSQQELAGDADMERAYISAVENGHKNIQVNTLVKLADALEVKAGILLDEALK